MASVEQAIITIMLIDNFVLPVTTSIVLQNKARASKQKRGRHAIDDMELPKSGADQPAQVKIELIAGQVGRAAVVTAAVSYTHLTLPTILLV